MFSFDPQITTGNALTILAIIGTSGIFVMRQSYAAGRYKKDFENLHEDLKEIKQTLKDQDATSRARDKADGLADGLLGILQQRVHTLEEEMVRCRHNIHHVANAAHVELFRRPE